MGLFDRLLGTGGSAAQGWDAPSPSTDPARRPDLVIDVRDGPMPHDRLSMAEAKATGKDPAVVELRCFDVAEELVELVELEIVELARDLGFAQPPVVRRA